jgi:hypothetical protein
MVRTSPNTTSTFGRFRSTDRIGSAMSEGLIAAVATW